MLLITKNLSKQYIIERSFFSNKKTVVTALENINFELKEGSILGVLGETGSGKTTLAKLITKLIEPTNGEVIFDISNVRRSVQMIFQNPFSSLNPRMIIKNILKEPFLIHHLANSRNLESKLKALLDKVNLNYECLERYPDEFSGGQRQRIAIARAISIEPKVLVCDEPTASLDLSVQAQILNLFLRLKEELGLSYIFISHNIEVISFIADEVLILYEGRGVERGLKDKIFNNPLHPYTKILLGSENYEFKKITFGNNLNAQFSQWWRKYFYTFLCHKKVQAEKDHKGCGFYCNCKLRTDICRQLAPQETEIEEGHYVSCHNPK